MSENDGKRTGRPTWLNNLAKGVQNALEVMRVGRLSEPVYAPYTIVHRGQVFRLRRYERDASIADAPTHPVMLVPPLMLTSEVYDISPENSAVGFLTRHGVDTFVLDFGAPEKQEGGLTRTLDDHVLAVDEATKWVRSLTDRDVHLAGYSQGGMFCYQAAAYRRCEGIRSLITFGSPVDAHRNLPGVSEAMATRLIDSISGLVRKPLEMAEAVPAAVTTNLFRIVSAPKEVKRFIDFVSHLHDREAIQRGEGSRRFLHGEGFVAWPGPAVRSFFEQFVVGNRMTSGGFVVAGRTLTLSDITCPVLYFVGLNDELARPAAVRAIHDAAPDAPAYEAAMRSGHFGLVVGSKSMQVTWPTVKQWLHWQEGQGPQPEGLVRAGGQPSDPPGHVTDTRFEDVEYSLSLLKDTAKDTASVVRRRLQEAGATLSAMFDNMRWQVPRLAKLERIDDDTLVSVGRELAEQAERIPNNTFFLWRGRAHSYADADRRVTYVTRGFIECGIERGDLVGVLMGARPTYLTVVAALNRLGAVAVLISPDERRVTIDTALRMVEVDKLVTDPERAALGRESFDGQVLVLGGGAGPRTLIDGVIDMERIDPDQVKLPAWYEPNPGRASDLAVVLFSTGKDEQPRAARITNRRWAVAAYGAAAASTLTQSDTVYCCMPLHHAAGLLVSVGGALAGGARLALSDRFDPEVFWTDVRRYGASVVYYAGEMCRALVDAPATTADRKNPIRLFAGSGMRMDMWKRLAERFDVSVLEFYATTEGNAVLANVAGQPVGALGRPLPASTDVAIVAYDFSAGELIRDSDGWAVRCYAEQPGMLLARLEGESEKRFSSESRRVVRDTFHEGDAWLITGDVLRQDAQDNYWFVDRAADMIHTPSGSIASIQLEDALYEMFDLARVAVYGLPLPGTDHDMPVATVVVREGHTLEPEALGKHVERKLDRARRPLFVRVRANIPQSVGYRPRKRVLRDEGLAPDDPGVFAYDPDGSRYVPLDAESYARAIEAFGGHAAHALGRTARQ